MNSNNYLLLLLLLLLSGIFPLNAPRFRWVNVGGDNLGYLGRGARSADKRVFPLDCCFSEACRPRFKVELNRLPIWSVLNLTHVL